MRITPSQDDINERKGIWQAICWRMNVHKVPPKELAHQTPYSQDLIERGIGGEAVPITLDFLRDCVKAFGLASGRAKNHEKPTDILSYGKCVELLKPSPAMPPRQGNFWDYL